MKNFSIVLITYFIFLVSPTMDANANSLCSKCREIQLTVRQGTNTEKRLQQDLTERRSLAKHLAHDDISKKARLTSEIFVLTAKIETIQNHRIMQQRQLSQLGCTACQKP